jgi:four helix bundle protein
MMPYERFEAWQLCHELTLAVYRVTESFPSDERFGLTSQARRAAVSAAVNIAEGAAKHGRREFRRYLDIAIGSLAELSYILRLSRDLRLVSADGLRNVDGLRERASQVTWSLYRSLGTR